MNKDSFPPPPDRWARLATEERLKQKRRDGCLLLVLILILIVVPVSLFVGGVEWNRWKRRNHPRRIQMINNARQIGLGLMEFQIEYGKFPDTSTIGEVKKQTGTTLMLTDSSSNDLLRQLIAGKFVGSEVVFGAFEMSSKLPDGLDDKDANALTTGECGFAYVLGPSSKDEPVRPLIFGPAKPGTSSIDSEMIDGDVVVLFTDNTVQRFLLNSKGMLQIRGNAFDPSHPVWNGKPLEIKWPN